VPLHRPALPRVPAAVGRRCAAAAAAAVCVCVCLCVFVCGYVLCVCMCCVCGGGWGCACVCGCVWVGGARGPADKWSALHKRAEHTMNSTCICCALPCLLAAHARICPPTHTLAHTHTHTHTHAHTHTHTHTHTHAHAHAQPQQRASSLRRCLPASACGSSCWHKLLRCSCRQTSWTC
jgi:hypothetical protein